MAATQQPPTPPAQAGAGCANCGAPMAPDQRYCLNCGARRGAPRVAPAAAAPPAPAEVVAEPVATRPADVSPLAAVIGIALLGGMLLIGVLIGRETGGDDTTPAPVVQVEPGATTTTPAAGAGAGADEAGAEPTEPGGAPAGDVTSEWPQGTDGWTVQLNTLPKDGATADSVQAAKDAAAQQGAGDAAVLDSDLYSSLPPGLYVIYSGVYSDRKSAEQGLEPLTTGFPGATVIEVSDGGGSAAQSGAPQTRGESSAGPGGTALDDQTQDQLAPEVGD